MTGNLTDLEASPHSRYEEEEDLSEEYSESVQYVSGDLSVASSVPPKKEQGIASNETRKVNFYRTLVVLVLVFAAIGTGVGIYFYISTSEQHAFERGYYSAAHKVLGAVGKSLEQTLKGMESLSVQIVSHVHATNQSWPTVYVPDYAFRASKIMALTDLVILSLMPLVTNNTRLEWEEFSVQPQYDEWLNSSIALQQDFDLFHGPVAWMDYDKRGTIWGDFGDIPYNVTRDYLPQWQNYPVFNDPEYPPYNWDWLSMQANEAPMTALYKHHACISEAYMLPDPNDPIDVAETKIWADWLKGFVQPGQPYDEPASEVVSSCDL
jgi:hypothetical protein